MLDRSRGAAKGENERAAEVENDEQRIHNDLFVDNQAGLWRLAYGDSHAREATTIASTPGSKVG